MTCRHRRGDPACTAGNSPEDLLKSALRDVEQFAPQVGVGVGSRTFAQMKAVSSAKAVLDSGRLQQELASARADARRLQAELDGLAISGQEYEILASAQIGNNLVLKVKYPSCARCSFEGEKIMVFLNCTLAEAIRWKVIDPHFREGSGKPTEAPPPSARFPATNDGWMDAMAYAMKKV